MKKLILTIALMLTLTGCSVSKIQDNNEQRTENNEVVGEIINFPQESEVVEKKQLTEDDYRELKVNEMGNIPVVMYHGLVKENPPSYYQITIDQLKEDLQYFYDNKYRPISMSDFVNNTIDVEAGFTPIVLTFDDGLGLGKESTLGVEFALEEKEGELVPVEGSPVQIMNDFAKEHPEFGKAATFYVNGGDYQFNGAGTLKDRFQYLIDNGYELGNHTANHAHLGKKSVDIIQKEIGIVDKMIKDNIDGFIPTTITYPYGARPAESEDRKYVLKGNYEGNEYEYQVAFREGPSMSFVPSGHIKFNPLNAPRLRGNKGDKDKADLWGYLERYEKYPASKYISDGDATTIVVPENKEKDVDKEKLGDKKLIVYKKNA